MDHSAHPTIVGLRDLDGLPIERLLVLLGGIATLVFGMLAFVFALADGGRGVVADAAVRGSAVLAFLLATVFGVLLLYAFSRMGKPEGAVLAFAFSLVLLVAGGLGGLVGGILGLTGAGLVLLRHVRWQEAEA